MDEVTITPSENGPYLVSGPVHLTAPDGRGIRSVRSGTTRTGRGEELAPEIGAQATAAPSNRNAVQGANTEPTSQSGRGC
jgi:hypothetical protein